MDKKKAAACEDRRERAAKRMQANYKSATSARTRLNPAESPARASRTTDRGFRSAKREKFLLRPVSLSCSPRSFLVLLMDNADVARLSALSFFRVLRRGPVVHADFHASEETTVSRATTVRQVRRQTSSSFRPNASGLTLPQPVRRG